MAKKVMRVVKIQLQAGKATPAPPVGTVLGPTGINLVGFTKDFNERTASQMGTIVPVEITIYEDRSFSFITKVSPMVELIKKATSVTKGSSEPHKNKVGTMTQDQVMEVAKTKLPDLNTVDLDAAMRMVAGTARSMGIKVEN